MCFNGHRYLLQMPDAYHGHSRQPRAKEEKNRVVAMVSGAEYCKTNVSVKHWK